jgi:tetratricopeptide (TPR) repeat protein
MEGRYPSSMQSVSESWNRARQLEAQGSWDQARSLYEAILASEPLHVPARLRMSRFEQSADCYLAAKQHLSLAASAIRERHGMQVIGYVTARLLEFAEEGEVASLILSLDWSDPEVIRQSPVLAQHLWVAGRYEDALRFLDAVATRVPAHHLLWFTRANVLRYLGDMTGAERAYEACLSLSPNFADAHWALATHARAQPPLARVARIREALNHAPDAGLEQAHLFYALFREYDAAGEIDEAWSALWQGAAIMRGRLVFDPERETERMEELMRCAVAALRPESDALPVPVFILGMPRTGTTLLDRILSNHSLVRSLGERNDLAAAVSETWGRFFRSALHADPRELLTQLDFGKAGDLYLQRLRRLAPQARYAIDKNPQNLFSIPIILQALPQARILCLRRDPMDACFSNLKELFQGDAYPYSYALDELADHCLRVRRWMEHWQGAASHSVRIVDYEDIVEDPDAAIAAVLEFLGLELQGGLSEITRNTAPVSTASSSQVRESIHARGVGAWKRYAQQLEPLRARLSA